MFTIRSRTKAYARRASVNETFSKDNLLSPSPARITQKNIFHTTPLKKHNFVMEKIKSDHNKKASRQYDIKRKAITQMNKLTSTSNSPSNPRRNFLFISNNKSKKHSGQSFAEYINQVRKTYCSQNESLTIQQPVSFELKGIKMVAPPKENAHLSIIQLKNSVKDQYVGKRIMRKCANYHKSIERPKKPLKSATITKKIKPVSPYRIITGAKRTQWTQRIHFKSREGMINKNLLIIQFEGIIGDFIYSKGFWQTTQPTLDLQIHLIQHLLEAFQICLLFRSPITKSIFVISQLIKQNVHIDAAYINIKVPVNYSQVYTDFNISNQQVESKVIIVGTYDSEEIDYCSCNTKFKEVLSCVPLSLLNSRYTSIPLVVLVKNRRLESDERSHSLRVLKEALSNLTGSIDSIIYKKLASSKVTVVETESIQDSYLKEQKKLKVIQRKRLLQYQKFLNHQKLNKSKEESHTSQVNVKYAELVIYNRHVRNGIREYYNSIEEPEYEAKPLKLSTTVIHKLIII